MGQLEQGTIAVKYYRQAVSVLLDEKLAIEQGRVSRQIVGQPLTFNFNCKLSNVMIRHKEILKKLIPVLLQRYVLLLKSI